MKQTNHQIYIYSTSALNVVSGGKKRRKIKPRKKQPLLLNTRKKKIQNQRTNITFFQRKAIEHNLLNKPAPNLSEYLEKKDHILDIIGIATIKFSRVNTIVTIRDWRSGRIKGLGTGGSKGIKGARRKTAQASFEAALKAGQIAYQKGIKYIHIEFCGLGKIKGRRNILLALRRSRLKTLSLSDITKRPHNGVRPRKKPRG